MANFLESFEDARSLNRIHGYDDDRDVRNERHAEKVIRSVFQQLGIQITEFDSYPVKYDISTSRASVTLKGESESLKKLSTLFQSGLSEDFVIESGPNMDLVVVFNFSQELLNTPLAH